MKKFLVLPLLFLPLLAGCTNQKDGITMSPQENLLDNPLYAERYSEELVGRMVDLVIYEDPLLEDEEKKNIADKARKDWMVVARKARADQRLGARGDFIGIKEYAIGEVLLLEDSLHLSTLFETLPGPNLHLYLTTAVDPRDVDFPDETAIDLGKLSTPYGAQSYPITTEKEFDLTAYRTVVLWDALLGRLYGFVQLTL